MYEILYAKEIQLRCATSFNIPFIGRMYGKWWVHRQRQQQNEKKTKKKKEKLKYTFAKRETNMPKKLSSTFYELRFDGLTILTLPTTAPKKKKEKEMEKREKKEKNCLSSWMLANYLHHIVREHVGGSNKMWKCGYEKIIFFLLQALFLLLSNFLTFHTIDARVYGGLYTQNTWW